MPLVLFQLTRIGVVTGMPMYDPRTVARKIPGIFDSIFPQLTPGIVAHFNRSAIYFPCGPIGSAALKGSKLQKAMLFELGFAAGERLLAGDRIKWEDCVETAVTRQRRHFDARIPEVVGEYDQHIAELVGRNIAKTVLDLAGKRDHPVIIAPNIPGFQWISSGHGDFSTGRTLIEVKCSASRFSASDYRQIVMYWLLSFAASLENHGREWSEGILLNPRSARYVALQFDDFLAVISAGRTKVEIYQLFSSIVGSRDGRWGVSAD